MTDSPWTFSGESSHVGGSGTVTLVDGTTFLVCDQSGDLPGHGARGLFMLDTRVLSRWQLTVNNEPVQPLSVTPNGPFSAAFAGRISDPALADAPLTVIQRRHVGRGMREDLDIRNHGAKPRDIVLKLRLGSDFGGLFDVKAGKESHHEQHVVQASDCSIVISNPHATDAQAVQSMRLWSSCPPTEIVGDVLAWEFRLEPGERWTNCFLISIEVGGVRLEPSYQCGEPVEDAIPISRLRQWRSQVTALDTDNTVLEAAVNKASEDLGALRIFDPDHPERVVVAAGAPWFMTLFGRDSLIASWMALPLDQDLAKGVLQELADAQGREINPKTEEQPGRILHEVRFDSSSSRMLGGSNTYYGTVDATPLFVMLVAELARWTGVTPTIRSLMPAVDKALAWIDDYGDPDGDGFVEYFRSGTNGLENQGWKDSWDGIRHSDGTVARGPIALCEVQGYVYAAFLARAELAQALGEPESISESFYTRAENLQAHFHDSFWLPESGWYAVGLDGNKEQIGSLSSNIGHLLWTGIVPKEFASKLATQLVSPSMFTGWGVRTLAANNPGFNPLSYHCGSVWPHDSAIAAAGLSRYGFDSEAHEVMQGLLSASTWTDGRLPELFAGFSIEDLGSPVPYPASCSPQAWAAASPLLLMRAMLGLEPNLLTGHLRLRPRLLPGTSRMQLTDIPLGTSRLDIAINSHDGGGNNPSVVVKGLPPHILLEIDET